MKAILGAGLILGTLAVGCASGSATGIAKVSEAERARASVAGRDPQTLAPQAFAEAELALRAAKEAERAGDGAAAALHAERAIAAYQHAIAIARLTRATTDDAQAKEALAHANEQAARYGAARRAAEREAEDLDKQLKVAREAERPAASGAADPEREKARLVAAESLLAQARLLCSAARLLSAAAPGLAEAEAATTDLEKKLAAAPKPAPIDAAGRARAACLGALTKAKRTGGAGAATTPAEPDQADALLGELSRARLAIGDAKREPSGKPTAVAPQPAHDLAPTRDERGVVLTLRALFAGKTDTLTPEAKATIVDLGKVAQAHPTFAMQIVIHDATPRGDAALAKKRGDAIARALAEGGAPSAKTKVELAGAKAPVFDPSDPARREKNERVEVVFVGG